MAPQITKRFLALYGTQRHITVFKTAHLSFTWAGSIRFTISHPASLRFILILYSRLRKRLLRHFFPSLSIPKLCTHFSCPSKVPRATLVSFCWMWSPKYSSVCSGSVLQIKKLLVIFSPVSCHFILGPNIFFSALFSKAISLCSFHKVRDQVAHP